MPQKLFEFHSSLIVILFVSSLYLHNFPIDVTIKRCVEIKIVCSVERTPKANIYFCLTIERKHFHIRFSSKQYGKNSQNEGAKRKTIIFVPPREVRLLPDTYYSGI